MPQGVNWEALNTIRARAEKQAEERRNIANTIALAKAKMPLQRELQQQTAQDRITQAIRLLKARQRYGDIGRPTTSISITEQPYSERLKAREITARSPEEWGKVGMAKKKGGFLGIGSKWEVGPEAIAAQEEARQILGRKYRTTKRITSKGGFGQNIIDTTADDLDEDTDIREQAIQELEDAGYPTTEENIQEAIRQLQGQ